jgi:SAM-dependent methyltransferase
MNKFSELSSAEGRDEHFRLLMQEWEVLNERAKHELIYEEVLCPLECSSQSELLFVKKESSFVRCPDCDIVYLSPQLTESVLAEHFALSPAWEVWAKAVLSTRGQQDIDREKYLTAINTIKRCHPNARSILDIGANSGFFLSLAQKAGLEVSGVEPSQAACEVAERLHELKPFNGRFCEFPANENSFDVITFWASLEYHKDPMGALQKAVGLLKPKGLLLIFVSGNANSLVMRMLRERCVGFLFNRPWYFSPLSLDRFVSHVDQRVSLRERYSQIDCLDVIERYLNYGDPYGKSSPQFFSQEERRMLSGIIDQNHMGYKFFSLYQKV